MALTQRALFEQLRTEALANHRQIAQLARPLDPERLVRRPAPSRWSVGEVLEHLCNADEQYREPVSSLVRAARPDAGAPLREWRPSLLGKLVVKGLESRRRLRAPKSFRPGPTPRNGVLEDFLARDTRLTTLMEDASSLDWGALRFTPPTLPPFLKMNLGDAFRVHVVHVRRHLGQMQRAMVG